MKLIKMPALAAAALLPFALPSAHASLVPFQTVTGNDGYSRRRMWSDLAEH